MNQIQISGAVFCRSAGICLFFSLLTGCRFITPDIKEQQELAKRGALGTGAPAWMATSNKDVASAGRASSGFLPESYSANLSGTAVSSVYTTIGNDDRYQQQQNDRLVEASAKSSAEDKTGPLDRIAKACPGTETEVNDALTTVDAAERLEKYRSLTKKCTSSADLWLWTGKGYLTQGKLSDAARSFEQALGVDPQNTEAAELLAEVRKQQNKVKSDKEAGGSK